MGFNPREVQMSELSYESRKELARLRANTRLNISRFIPTAVVKDSDNDDGSPEWMPMISEPDDVGIQATPEVAQFGGVSWNTGAKTQYDYDRTWTMSELVAYLAESILGPQFQSPARSELPKPVRIEPNRDAVKMHEQLHDEEFRYVSSKTALYNGDLDQEVLKRWNQPDDVLEALDGADDAKFGFRFDEGQTFDWEGYMTDFREAQLRRLLKEYFGSDQYMDREIVLKWVPDATRPGKWMPGEKMVVRDWVAAKIAEKDSRLSAYSSCAGFLRSKITRKKVANDKTGASGSSWWKTYNAV